MNGSSLKILVLPTELNFRAKAHLASQQSHNSRAWGWKYGYKELSLSSSWPPSISSSGWLWVEVSDRLNPVFPIELKLESKNPLSQETYHTIPNLRDGNMGTRVPSLSSSQPLSISSSKWLWVEVSDLLCFYAFSAPLLLVFWFSLVKALLAFCSLYIWNFGLDSP